MFLSGKDKKKIPLLRTTCVHPSFKKRSYGLDITKRGKWQGGQLNTHKHIQTDVDGEGKALFFIGTSTSVFSALWITIVGESKRDKSFHMDNK